MSFMKHGEGRSTIVVTTSCFFANFMRTFLLHSTPSICVDDIVVDKNSSTFKDEEIQMRIGLLPLKGIEKIGRIEVGTVLCTGHIDSREESVRMEHAVFDHPIVKGEGLICTLRKDEHVSFSFKVKVGDGSMGAKFCPVVAPTSWPDDENEDETEGKYSISFESNGTDHEWMLLTCLDKMEEKVLQMKHSLCVSRTERM